MSYKILRNIIIVSLLFTACNDDIEFKLNAPQKIKINNALNLSVTELNGKIIDSIIFHLDGHKINAKNNSSIDIKDKILGTHVLSATIYFENTSKKLYNTIYFLAVSPPSFYSYEVINTFPHDPRAFTQGLEFYNGFLYESTGQKGKSSIRKTEIKTGKTIQNKNLDAKYFGEGITIFNNKIYQLTWQSKVGFIYDLETLKQEGSFTYGRSIEGWGLSHNKSELIKSDGTERIWFLNPDTQKETRFIEAYTNTRKAESLNEIEYINGKIYANIWQKNTIIIINPKNGTIEGVVDLENLAKRIKKSATNGDQVLNGIAYDAENDRLFVTGKNWDKTFEIKLSIKK